MRIVILGATDTCKPCRKLKEALTEAGVEFTFYEMSGDSPVELELRKQVREAGGKTIPALFLDGVYQAVETPLDLLTTMEIL